MFTVKASLTPAPRQKRREVIENDEFAGFARRIIRAHGRRVSTGDVEALRDLVALSATLDNAITDAVVGLRAFTELADRLDIATTVASHLLVTLNGGAR